MKRRWGNNYGSSKLERTKTLDFPEFQVGDPAEKELNRAWRDPLPPMFESAFGGTHQEIRATREKRENRRHSKLSRRENPGQRTIDSEKPSPLGRAVWRVSGPWWTFLIQSNFRTSAR